MFMICGGLEARKCRVVVYLMLPLGIDFGINW